MEDKGAGFDIVAVKASVLGVDMHSMSLRTAGVDGGVGGGLLAKLHAADSKADLGCVHPRSLPANLKRQRGTAGEASASPESRSDCGL